jgi:hypothetical protein
MTLPPINQKKQPHKPKKNINSFHEQEKKYWTEVENLRLVKKLYKIDTSQNNHIYVHSESKPSSYMLKQEKERKKIFEENQRMYDRLSRKTLSHYAK